MLDSGQVEQRFPLSFNFHLTEMVSHICGVQWGMLFFTRRADPCDHVGRVMALGTHLHQDLACRAECGNLVR